MIFSPFVSYCKSRNHGRSSWLIWSTTDCLWLAYQSCGCFLSLTLNLKKFVLGLVFGRIKSKLNKYLIEWIVNVNALNQQAINTSLELTVCISCERACTCEQISCLIFPTFRIKTRQTNARSTRPAKLVLHSYRNVPIVRWLHDANYFRWKSFKELNLYFTQHENAIHVRIGILSASKQRQQDVSRYIQLLFSRNQRMSSARAEAEEARFSRRARSFLTANNGLQLGTVLIVIRKPPCLLSFLTPLKTKRR